MISRRQRLVLACAALSLTASVVCAAPHPIQPPMPGAVRVITVGPDNSTGKKGLIGSVIQPWLSGHEVLHFRHGLLSRLDVTTGADTALPALTRRLLDSECFLYFLSVSPDGRQVLWGVSANNPLFVASLDGARCAQWPSNGGLSEAYWCADGRHWVQFQFGGTGAADVHWTVIQEHSLDTPHASETFRPIPPGLRGLDVLAAPSADRVIARTHDPRETAKVTPVRGGFIIRDRVTLRAAQTISVWSLRQSLPLQQWAVRLPGRVQSVAVSPDGQRAAWLLTGVTKASQSLWVSRLDGSGLREIGAVRPSHRRAGERRVDFVSQVQWVPGDKAVSFQYGDALWTLPAR